MSPGGLVSVTANMDRHHYEVYDFPDEWKNDTVPVLLDNGRGYVPRAL